MSRNTCDLISFALRDDGAMPGMSINNQNNAISNFYIAIFLLRNHHFI